MNRLDATGESGGGIRLHRYLAQAGKGSRRACEDLIRQGRVSVDGSVVREMGTLVNPAENRIELDGERVSLPKKVYYIVNKPKGFLCTNAPEEAPRRVIDLLPERGYRLYVAGRLDLDSEGLVFVTNDGDVAQFLTHPSHEVLKTYKVRVKGRIGPETLANLKKGVHIAEGKVRPVSVKKGGGGEVGTELTVVLGEGKNREVRRIFARVGHPVKRLKRTAIGPFLLLDLKPGGFRELMPATVLREIGRMQKKPAGRGPERPFRPGRGRGGSRPGGSRGRGNS